MAKGGYVGIAGQYTPVEYIEGTGTQYIDTGVKPTNTMRMSAEVSMVDNSAERICDRL